MTFSIRSGTPNDFGVIVALDDDAARLYDEAGLDLHLADDHPFTVAERAMWLRSLEAGDTFVAVDAEGAPVGFAALELVDGAPYLDQLSVRRASMGRGIGRALLSRAVVWARAHGRELWLTTYGHLPWNRPFYEKEGFAVVAPEAWSPGMAALIADQRSALPAPAQRVVMRRPL
jgi:GNAT superfamily N-acetyltransferase